MSTLNELPFELLDAVLENSLLYLILNSSPKERDEDAIRSLASVNFCWFQRTTKKRFKKRIWHRLKDFYATTRRRSAIIRNNLNYLLENIQPNDELILLLLSLNCITEEQSRYIQRQRFNQDKTVELWRFLKPFNETKYSNIVECLQRTNQKTIARIVENGGVVMKVVVKHLCRSTMPIHVCPTSVDLHQLQQAIIDLRSRPNLRSHQTDKLISQLKMEGIEILNSQLDRQTLVVWIWCRSQSALERFQKLYELNQLNAVLFGLVNVRQSNSEWINSKLINVDSSQFKKTVAVCPISIKLTKEIDVDGCERIFGVTKLQDEIFYVLCQLSLTTYVIEIFEDQESFHFKQWINLSLEGIKGPDDIAASKKENCLYISELNDKCIWKIARETDGKRKIIKWLLVDYPPRLLSESIDGELLVLNYASSSLMLYGSDAELLRFIRFPRDIEKPICVAETSNGNFIILHKWIKDGKGEPRSTSSWRTTRRKWVVSEVTRDGAMTVCRFIPSNKAERLKDPFHLSLDSDDRVLVADERDGRVILLDSDLKWNRILRDTVREEKENRLRWPYRLFYDKEKKQLIVRGYSYKRVMIYTLSRN